MRHENDGIVSAICGLSVAALVAVFANQWLVFGWLVCSLLVVTLALGFGRERRGRAVSYTLILLLGSYVALLTAMAWMERSLPPTPFVLGFPKATALLVYVLWPLPIAAGVLYAFVFPKLVPPDETAHRLFPKQGSERGDG